MKKYLLLIPATIAYLIVGGWWGGKTSTAMHEEWLDPSNVTVWADGTKHHDTNDASDLMGLLNALLWPVTLIGYGEALATGRSL